MKFVWISLVGLIIGIEYVDSYAYTNTYQSSSGCTGTSWMATTYQYEGGYSSGCHDDMVWQWSNGKPTCDSFTLKIQDFLNDTTGCSVPSDPTIYWLKAVVIGTDSSDAECLKVYRNMNEMDSMYVATYYDIFRHHDVLDIMIYTGSTCYPWIKHFSVDDFTSGESCITSTDGISHLYVRWC